MKETQDVDDETLDHALGRIVGALIFAVFDGRSRDDPTALKFISSMETEASRIIDSAPQNATMMRMAARLARVAIGMTDDVH